MGILKKPLLHSLSLEELESVIVAAGFPRYRAMQVWHGLYRHFATNTNEIPAIPEDLKEFLSASYELTPVMLMEREKSDGSDDTTIKFLLALTDDETIETVLIPARMSVEKDLTNDSRLTPVKPKIRNTICVSSQVGCKFACSFCASGKAGYVRNLEAGEIVGQIIEVARTLGKLPDNIVFMGVGEPLDNYDNVLSAI
ncbi:MAG: hypothetical protein GX811_11705 [Lentisphaerae bacterium]|nr:hypothetical protein [Lentisphaerota bacterium]